jgi:hypothetical protein
LLLDRSGGEVDGNTVVSVGVVQRALSGWQDQLNHCDGLVFEHHLVEWFFFDRDGSSRLGLLRAGQRARREEDRGSRKRGDA